MDAPKVSVVTTVYNGEPYMDRAVPSILGQTFRDFEWIIVDDGSQDGTPELLKRLAANEPRVTVLSPGRLGIVAAANHGIRHARGEYIARQDFDDRSYPDRLTVQTALLDARPEVGVVGGAYVIVDEHRNERYVRILPTSHRDLVRAMAKSTVFAHTTTMFRRQAWVDVGGYSAASDVVVDLILWLSVAKHGWLMASVPEILGEHYVHATSYFHRTFRYAERQRKLARVQARVIRDLRLPPWMYVYVLGRYLYPYLPTALKTSIRHQIAGWRERDV